MCVIILTLTLSHIFIRFVCLISPKSLIHWAAWIEFMSDLHQEIWEPPQTCTMYDEYLSSNKWSILYIRVLNWHILSILSNFVARMLGSASHDHMFDHGCDAFQYEQFVFMPFKYLTPISCLPLNNASLWVWVQISKYIKSSWWFLLNMRIAVPLSPGQKRWAAQPHTHAFGFQERQLRGRKRKEQDIIGRLSYVAPFVPSLWPTFSLALLWVVVHGVSTNGPPSTQMINTPHYFWGGIMMLTISCWSKNSMLFNTSINSRISWGMNAISNLKGQCV